MDKAYPYKVAGLYDDLAPAVTAHRALVDADIADSQVMLIGPQEHELDARIEPEGAAVRRTAVRDLLTGAGIGGVVGIGAVGALGGMSIPLIVAQPAAASALGAAYGAAIGSLAGGTKALRMDSAGFAALVKDEVAKGRWVLLVHLPDAGERDRAIRMLGATSGELRHSS